MRTSLKSNEKSRVRSCALILPLFLLSCSQQGNSNLNPTKAPFVLLVGNGTTGSDKIITRLCYAPVSNAIDGIDRHRDYFGMLGENAVIYGTASLARGQEVPATILLNVKNREAVAFGNLRYVGRVNDDFLLLHDGRGGYRAQSADLERNVAQFSLRRDLVPFDAAHNRLLVYNRIHQAVSVFSVPERAGESPRLIVRFRTPRQIYRAKLGDQAMAIAWFEEGAVVPRLRLSVRRFDGSIVQEVTVDDPEAELIGLDGEIPVILSRQNGGFRCPLQFNDNKWRKIAACEGDILRGHSAAGEFVSTSFEERVVDVIYKEASLTIDSHSLDYLVQAKVRCADQNQAESVFLTLPSGLEMRGALRRSEHARGLAIYFQGGPFVTSVGGGENRPLFSALLAQGISVLVVFPPGTAGFGGEYRRAGRSFGHATEQSREFVEMFLKRSPPTGRVIAVGSSFGGQYAIELARITPAISGTLLQDPACSNFSQIQPLRYANSGLGHIMKELGSAIPCEKIGVKPVLVYQNRHDDRVRPHITRSFFDRADQANKTYVSGPGGHGDLDQNLFAEHFPAWFDAIVPPQ